MNVEERFIKINEFSRPGTKRSVTRNIVFHFTANPGASADNHFKYFGETIANQNPNDDQKDTYASAHAFIDRVKTLVIIPLDEMAYHASNSNPYSIGVELCIEKDGSFHPDTIKRAIEFGAALCKQYALSPLTDYLRHFDITGKICPKPWVDDVAAWEKFKADTQCFLKQEGARKLEFPNDWQYTMLGNALTELSKLGGGPDGSKQLLTYEWAQKAYAKELSVDDALFVLTVALARSLKCKVEAS